MKRLLDYDPITGIKTWHDYDEASDTTSISTEQDVSQVLEANKAVQNMDGYSQKGIKDSWWHIARIPNALIDKWLHEEGIDVLRASKDPMMWRRVKRKLMDPEYRYLRTGTGRL